MATPVPYSALPIDQTDVVYDHAGVLLPAALRWVWRGTEQH